ncbi:MAG: hypothetical protein NTV54_07625 [Ignavibacteriales bacterium]|nr:hypothetical protein [Ignavibacteriales bacterium]
MKKTLLALCASAFLGFGAVQAQTLQEQMQKLSIDAAKAYVAPIVSGFGADLNGGWFHKAPSAKMFGFDLEFGGVFMGTPMKDENKHFTFAGQITPSTDIAEAMAKAAISNYSALSSSQKNLVLGAITSQAFNVSLSGPTVVGPKDENVTLTTGARTINVPGYGNVAIPATPIPLEGVNGALDGLTMVPLFAPQLSIGTIFGTQATFRYLPEVEVNSDIGKFKYFGFGIQHNPGIWFPNPLPVDLSASFFTQKLSVGTLFETKTTAFGVNVSKRFGPGALNITPYAGFMLESSQMTFTYDLNTLPGTPPQHIEFALDGENKSRLTLGLSLKILFLNVNADYNIGKYNSFTGGLMFII